VIVGRQRGAGFGLPNGEHVVIVVYVGAEKEHPFAVVADLGKTENVGEKSPGALQIFYPQYQMAGSSDSESHDSFSLSLISASNAHIAAISNRKHHPVVGRPDG
jgi:hypothetical protein